MRRRSPQWKRSECVSRLPPTSIGRHPANVSCSARSTGEMENTHRPAPGMIGRTGELPLRTARFSDYGCNPQRRASSSVVSVSRPAR